MWGSAVSFRNDPAIKREEKAMVFSTAIEKEIDRLYEPYDRPDSPGFAVGIVHRGEFIYNKGFGQANLEHPSPITSQTVFDVGSMAKPFVGMAVALLEEEGRLSIQDRMKRYLPEFPDYADDVTIANLLYHTSGIRNYYVLVYYMIGCHETDAFTDEQVYDLLCGLTSLSFRPGTKWEYSDSNYFLLARIVERVSGNTLGEFARTHIFDPLGMDDTRFREMHSRAIPNRALSYVRHPIRFASPSVYSRIPAAAGTYHTCVSNYEHIGAEGLFTTLDDLFNWDRNMSDNQLGRGRNELIDRILTPGKFDNGVETRYGFGLNVGTYKRKRFFGHDGAIHGYTSGMMRLPDHDLTIICLANTNVVGSWEYRARMMDLLFPGEDTPQRPTVAVSTVELSDDEMTKIVGAYQDPETSSVWEIDRQAGRIEVRENRERTFEIAPVGPSEFRALDPELDLSFRLILDGAGQVSELRGTRGQEQFAFKAFLRGPLSPGELQAYVGEYACPELNTTLVVEVRGGGLCLRNVNRHYCSMDLFYEPTIEDHFRSYDPNPISSSIAFLRQGGKVAALVYRDYDGDRREDLIFQRMPEPR
jgi:CubicO group peptidase (beta-lactamase class C family)